MPIVLDVKRAEGREIMVDLLRTADVFVHNSKPGTVEGLGLGKEDIRDISARIVSRRYRVMAEKDRGATTEATTLSCRASWASWRRPVAWTVPRPEPVMRLSTSTRGPTSHPVYPQPSVSTT